MAEYSREIARRFGYSEKAQNEIYMMGLLHDVGKIGVPDAVINKPGRLTDDEFAEMKIPATLCVRSDRFYREEMRTGGKHVYKRSNDYCAGR